MRDRLVHRREQASSLCVHGPPRSIRWAELVCGASPPRRRIVGAAATRLPRTIHRCGGGRRASTVQLLGCVGSGVGASVDHDTSKVALDVSGPRALVSSFRDGLRGEGKAKPRLRPQIALRRRVSGLHTAGADPGADDPAAVSCTHAAFANLNLYVTSPSRAGTGFTSRNSYPSRDRSTTRSSFPANTET